MSNAAMSIGQQMHDFQNTISSIESQYNSMIVTAGEMINDLNFAKNSIKEASSACQQQNQIDELEQFTSKMSNIVYKECDSLKDSFAKINQFLTEAKHFQQKELEARERFVRNPQEFDEKELKNLLNAKPPASNTQIEEHPMFVRLVELIENAKHGVSNDDEEDLVMETNQNQVTKCPITSRPIEVPCKNTRCAHVYERDAILNYIKGKTHRNCPFAGCKAIVMIEK